MNKPVPVNDDMEKVMNIAAWLSAETEGLLIGIQKQGFQLKDVETTLTTIVQSVERNNPWLLGK